jgi:Zinc finger, C3HC4 type (RING finger)
MERSAKEAMTAPSDDTVAAAAYSLPAVASGGGWSRNGGDSAGAPCVLCLDADRRVALLPCGHVCLCTTCVGHIVEPGNAGGRCPVCRGVVTGTQVRLQRLLVLRLVCGHALAFFASECCIDAFAPC